MIRGGIALVTALALAACDDAPPKAAPRPPAPSAASRELLAAAMKQAVADAEQAQRLIAPPPPPPPPPDQIAALVDLDDVQGRLLDLDVDPSMGVPMPSGTLDVTPSDDVFADPDDDPDDVAGTAGAPSGVRVVLTSDADGVDPVVIEGQRGVLIVRATMCQRRLSPDDDPTTATVTVSRSPMGAVSVRVNSAGPAGSCLKDLSYPDLPPGTTLTFQLTIPAP